MAQVDITIKIKIKECDTFPAKVKTKPYKGSESISFEIQLPEMTASQTGMWLGKQSFAFPTLPIWFR